MSLDTSLVGQNTAELMEALDNTYAGIDATVAEVMTIVVVRTPEPPGYDPDEHGELCEDGYTYIHHRSTEGAFHRQLGILEAARWSIERR